LYLFALFKTPNTTFPYKLCLSTLPSPVITMPHYSISLSYYIIYIIFSIPFFNLAFKNMIAPPLIPPPAPLPFSAYKFLLNFWIKI